MAYVKAIIKETKPVINNPGSVLNKLKDFKNKKEIKHRQLRLLCMKQVMRHYICEKPMSNTPDNKTQSQKETEAESAAFVVCQHYGIDTSDYSFGYAATWASLFCGMETGEE